MPQLIGLRTGIKMTKKNRLAILRGARKILDDPKRWTRHALRRSRTAKGEVRYSYCLLGACEQAAYDLGLADPGKYAFRTSRQRYNPDKEGIGYDLGKDLSLEKFSTETLRLGVASVNDLLGYEKTVLLLDEYIAEVAAGRQREMD